MLQSNICDSENWPCNSVADKVVCRKEEGGRDSQLEETQVSKSVVTAFVVAQNTAGILNMPERQKRNS